MRRFLLALAALCLACGQADSQLLSLGIGGVPYNLFSVTDAADHCLGTWNLSDANCTNNVTTSPDGNTNAWSLNEDTLNQPHYSEHPDVTLATTGGTATFAVFIKQSTVRYVNIGMCQGGGCGSSNWATVDTSTCTFTQTGGASFISDNIVSLANSWCYASVTGAFAGVGTIGPILALSNSSTPGGLLPSYLGASHSIFVYTSRFSNGKN